MKAFILAAGLGSRLAPITDKIPKCMVEVNGIPIIKRQIEAIYESGISDIYVVSGYKYSTLIEYLSNNFPNVKVLINPDYNTTNNMFSALLTIPYADQDSLYMNADVFFETSYIKKIVESNHLNAILVEKNRFEEENMKITVNDNRVIKISKQIEETNSYGTSIDVYKFSRDTIKELKKIMEFFIFEKKELKLWNEVAIDEIFKDIHVYPIEVGNKWFEIDNLEDLEKASKLFK